MDFYALYRIENDIMNEVFMTHYVINNIENCTLKNVYQMSLDIINGEDFGGKLSPSEGQKIAMFFKINHINSFETFKNLRPVVKFNDMSLRTLYNQTKEKESRGMNSAIKGTLTPLQFTQIIYDEIDVDLKAGVINPALLKDKKINSSAVDKYIDFILNFRYDPAKQILFNSVHKNDGVLNMSLREFNHVT